MKGSWKVGGGGGGGGGGVGVSELRGRGAGWDWHDSVNSVGFNQIKLQLQGMHSDSVVAFRVSDGEWEREKWGGDFKPVSKFPEFS